MFGYLDTGVSRQVFLLVVSQWKPDATNQCRSHVWCYMFLIQLRDVHILLEPDNVWLRSVKHMFAHQAHRILVTVGRHATTHVECRRSGRSSKGEPVTPQAFHWNESGSNRRTGPMPGLPTPGMIP